MEHLKQILKEIFPNCNPYPVAGIQYGLILRQPNGYYKIYENGTKYKIEQWSYDTLSPNPDNTIEIPREFIADYFRQLAGLA